MQMTSRLGVPGARFDTCVERDIDITVSAAWALDEVAAAARSLGATASVQLKADTGLSRNGATPDDWPALTPGQTITVDGGWTAR